MTGAIRRPTLQLARIACIALAVLLAGHGRGVAATQTTTITTTYQYNADGAPTAVTTQVDGQAPTTIYLTWDNFTPNTAAPSTGTVSAANGNLVGVAASPGPPAQYAYDTRDRLITCDPAGQTASTYTYDPISHMDSSTLASGDALLFYHDNAPLPVMVNSRQPSTGLASSFLGPVRYLSDGTEEVLLLPRKDTAGVYDADAQSLSPYAYEPYGAPLTPTPESETTTYDLGQNPFQFAGEYLDPTCDTYYMRARWYLAAQETFLSRDPADGLHRYSYTAGNPVGRVDPSGLKYTGEDFSRSVGKAVGRLDPHMWAYIEPIMPIWGDVLGGIELVGLLPSFWHHPTTAGMVEFSFLTASIVAEAGGETKWFDGLFASSSRAFGTRIGIDVALGASQTAAQSYRHGRVDVPSMIQGVDTTMYGVLWGRLGAGVGYRPYGLGVDDVDALAATHFRDPNNVQQALVFRVRSDTTRDVTTPVLEHYHLGNYHEAVFAVARDSVMSAEVGLGDHGYTWMTKWSRDPETLRNPSRFIAGRTPKRLMLVGSFRQDAVDAALRTEMSLGEQNMLHNITGRTVSDLPEYRKYSNNCQHNAARVRGNIVRFHNNPVENLTD
jgi:RHS repeat-associated protein